MIYIIGRFHSKVLYQNEYFLQILELITRKDYIKIRVNYATTTNQVNI